MPDAVDNAIAEDLGLGSQQPDQTNTPAGPDAIDRAIAADLGIEPVASTADPRSSKVGRVGAALGRGTVKVARGIAGGAPQAIGGVLQQAAGPDKTRGGFGDIRPGEFQGQGVGGYLGDVQSAIGREIVNPATGAAGAIASRIGQGLEHAANRVLYSKTLSPPTDTSFWLDRFPEYVPGVVGIVASSGAGGLPGAASMLFGQTAGEHYIGARDSFLAQGRSPQEAEALASSEGVAAGTGAALLGTLGVPAQVMMRNPLVRRAIVKAGLEALPQFAAEVPAAAAQQVAIGAATRAYQGIVSELGGSDPRALQQFLDQSPTDIGVDALIGAITHSTVGIPRAVGEAKAKLLVKEFTARYGPSAKSRLENLDDATLTQLYRTIDKAGAVGISESGRASTLMDISDLLNQRQAAKQTEAFRGMSPEQRQAALSQLDDRHLNEILTAINREGDRPTGYRERATFGEEVQGVLNARRQAETRAREGQDGQQGPGPAAAPQAAPGADVGSPAQGRALAARGGGAVQGAAPQGPLDNAPPTGGMGAGVSGVVRPGGVAAGAQPGDVGRQPTLDELDAETTPKPKKKGAIRESTQEPRAPQAVPVQEGQQPPQPPQGGERPAAVQQGAIGEAGQPGQGGSDVQQQEKLLTPSIEETMRRTGFERNAPAIEYMGPGRGWPRDGDPQIGGQYRLNANPGSGTVTVEKVWRTATASEGDGQLNVTVRSARGDRYTLVGKETKTLTAIEPKEGQGGVLDQGNVPGRVPAKEEPPAPKIEKPIDTENSYKGVPIDKPIKDLTDEEWAAITAPAPEQLEYRNAELARYLKDPRFQRTIREGEIGRQPNWPEHRQPTTLDYAAIREHARTGKLSDRGQQIQTIADTLAGRGFDNEPGRLRTAGHIYSAISTGRYNDIVHPMNSQSRKLFTELTGVKLPKTVSGTQALFRGEPFPMVGQQPPAKAATSPDSPGQFNAASGSDPYTAERLRKIANQMPAFEGEKANLLREWASAFEKTGKDKREVAADLRTLVKADYYGKAFGVMPSRAIETVLDRAYAPNQDTPADVSSSKEEPPNGPTDSKPAEQQLQGAAENAEPPAGAPSGGQSVLPPAGGSAEGHPPGDVLGNGPPGETGGAPPAGGEPGEPGSPPGPASGPKRPGGRGGGGGSRGGRGAAPATTDGDTEGGGKLDVPKAPRPPAKPERDVPNAPVNHVIKPGDQVIPGGDVAKIRANIDAIKLLKTLETEDRYPTAEEKTKLVQYVGWGGLKPMFDRAKIMRVESRERAPSYYNQLDADTEAWKKKWWEPAKELKELLGEEEWDRAARSVLNAHYTSEDVIRHGLWAIADQLGVKGGRFLENSAGIGHVIGMAPKQMQGKWVAVDLDTLSARFLRKLYPQAVVYNMGFQDAPIENGSQDLVIGNVPFHETGPNDERYPRFNLHNYMIARSIDTLKPGGIAVLISSDSTMDRAGSQGFRKWAAQRADLIGAIRLPNDAFMANAGTAVTTDILILRKRGGAAVVGHPWLDTKAIDAVNDKETDKDGNPLPKTIQVNEFYAAHPEMMLGNMGYTGTMYRADSPALAPIEGKDLVKQLKEAVKRLPKNIAGDFDPTEAQRSLEAASEGAKEGSYQIKDGKVKQVSKGMLEDPWWKGEKGADRREKVAASLIGLRESVRSVIDAQRDPSLADAEVERRRAELAAAYKKHTAKHGQVTESYSRATMGDDPEWAMIDALEDIERRVVDKTYQSGKRQGQTYKDLEEYTKPADILTKRTQWPSRPPERAESLEDALAISMSWAGRLDPAYMAKLLGKDQDETERLIVGNGLGFRNPETGQVEHRDEYLSGDVKEKLRQAERANEGNTTFAGNVEALKAVQPPPIPVARISIKLGAPWVPPDVLSAWAQELFGTYPGQISFVPAIRQYAVKWSDSAENSAANTSQWAVMIPSDPDDPNSKQIVALTAIDLINASLEQKQAVVTRPYMREDGTEGRMQDGPATAAAQAKQQQLRDHFQRWAKTGEHAHKLAELYNEKYGGLVRRDWTPALGKDGVFPQQSTAYLKPRRHQAAATMRGISQSYLLAHEVGLGKTLTFIQTAMEWRRLGLAKKPVIVVQNSTTQQIAKAAARAYPNGRFLVPGPKDFSPERRQRTMARIATGDFDAIILPQSQFDAIPDNPDLVNGWANEQKQALIDALMEETEGKWRAGKSKSRDPKVRALEDALQKLEKQLEKITTRKTDNVMFWDQLGVDGLIVDEAHAYKKMWFLTRMGRVRGLDTEPSLRGVGLLLKARDIRKRVGDGRNIILSTGTPVTNTLAEMWNMMRLVRPDLMEKYGIPDFDSFQQTFTEVRNDLEMDATGRWRSTTRLSSFDNVKALQPLWLQVADVVRASDVEESQRAEGKTDFERPVYKGGKQQFVELDAPPAMRAFNDALLEMYEAYEALTPKEKMEPQNKAIPLTIRDRARKAAVDMRLLNPKAEFDPGSKTAAIIKDVLRIYKQEDERAGVQAIFSDRFQTPTHRSELIGLDQDGDPITKKVKLPDDQYFNLFDDIKKRLVEGGIPENEIVVMPPSPDSPKAAAIRDAIMTDIQQGKIRVVMGTRARMGVGVNIQDRLYAVHHFDAPDRPADQEQADGRQMRQGNKYALWGIPVENRRYGYKQSFDAGQFGIIARKQKAIEQLIAGRDVGDSIEDVEGKASASYEETAAAFSGDPDTRRRFELRREIQSLEASEANHINQQAGLRQQVEEKARYVEALKAKVGQAQSDIRLFKSITDPAAPMTVNGKAMPSRDAAMEALEKDVEEGLQAAKEYYADPSTLQDRMRNNDYRRGAVKFTMGPAEATISVYGRSSLDGSPMETSARMEAYVFPEDRKRGAVFLHSWQEYGLQTAKGLVARLVSAAERMETEAAAAPTRLAQAQRQLQQTRDLIGQPFEDAAKLEQAKKELEEVNTRLGAKDEADKERRRNKGRGTPGPNTPGASAGQSESSTQSDLDKPGPSAAAIAMTGGDPILMGIANGLAGKIPDAKELIRNAGTTLRRLWGESAGHMAPATTRANQEAGEALVRYMAARVHAGYLAQDLAAKVLGNNAPAKVANTVGALFEEDRLRAIRQKFLDDGDQESADAVTTLVGQPGSPFQTEAEYQKLWQDKVVLEAAQRHRDLVAPVEEQMQRAATEMDPADPMPGVIGEKLGAYIHLLALHPDDQTRGPRIGGGAGNLRNPLKKKPVTALRAYGTGQSYAANYVDIITASIAKKAEIAAQKEAYRALTDAGLAVIAKPGQTIQLGGKATYSLPVKFARNTFITTQEPPEGSDEEPITSAFTVNNDRHIYIRADLYPEIRRALNVDARPEGDLVEKLGDLPNGLALVGPIDAFWHTYNLVSNVVTRPFVAGSVIGELAMAMGGVPNMLGTLYIIGKSVYRAARPSGADRTEMSDLSRIGAMRAPHVGAKGLVKTTGSVLNMSWWLGKVDPGVRLALNDGFTQMAELGLVPDTETNRREFVNQAGQYLERAQPAFRQAMKRFGLAKFVVAGVTMRNLAYRTVSGRAGAKARGFFRQQLLRGLIWSRLLGTLLQAAALSYLVGRLMGREDARFGGRKGIPYGTVDLYTEDKDGKPQYWDMFGAMGLRRMARATGLDATIEGMRHGVGTAATMDKAIDDVVTSGVLHPMAGPPMRAAVVGLTGKDISGRQVAPVVPPNESQRLANLKAGGKEMLGQVGSAIGLENEGNPNNKGVAHRLFGRFLVKSGKSDKEIENLPKRIDASRLNDFNDDLARRIRRDHPAVTQTKGETDAEFRTRVQARSRAISEMLAKETAGMDPHQAAKVRYEMLMKRRVLANR